MGLFPEGNGALFMVERCQACVDEVGLIDEDDGAVATADYKQAVFWPQGGPGRPLQ